MAKELALRGLQGQIAELYEEHVQGAPVRAATNAGLSMIATLGGVAFETARPDSNFLGAPPTAVIGAGLILGGLAALVTRNADFAPYAEPAISVGAGLASVTITKWGQKYQGFQPKVAPVSPDAAVAGGGWGAQYRRANA